MGLFKSLRESVTPDVQRVHGPTVTSAPAPDWEKHGGTPTRSSASLEPRNGNEEEVQRHPDEVTKEAQDGVKKAEAAALVWSKKQVWCAYGWIWVCFFALALQQGMTPTLNVNAYSNFRSAPQIHVALVLSSIVGGIIKLPIAKLLNLWGRAEGFLSALVAYEMGMIIIASSSGPNGFAVGYVLYWIGYDALYFIMDVFVADTSGLRNRAWAFAFVSTPFICTAFTAPLAATLFIKTSGWRWAYGSFTIIQFATFVPLVVTFGFFSSKAAKMGLWQRKPSGRTRMQSVMHHFHEFDMIGAFIIMAAFIMFLLPFSLKTNGIAEYRSASFTAMVAVGICIFPVFFLWEAKFARTPFMKWQLLKQRTVLGACCLAAVLNFSFYLWQSRLLDFIIVVHHLDTTKAGYIMQIYNVGSCFWGLVFGIYVRQTKHFKKACLFFALPVVALGAGLMIHFRGSSQSVGYLIMCQILIAFGSGTLVIGQSMAVMAAADREGVPLMLALVNMCQSVGGAIGAAVAGAVYANTFQENLAAALPNMSSEERLSLYDGGYLAQANDSAYPLGGPERLAIENAWACSQKYLCIAATAVIALGFPAVAVWKNYNVDKKQNKGTVI